MLTSEEVIEQIRSETDTVLLSFSCGKDSIAAYLAIKHRFRRIVPFYLYAIPGLQFIEESLRRFEKELFGCHIYRLPHPSLYRKLNNFVFQPPERIEIIERANLPSPTHDEIHRAFCRDLGIDYSKSWIASGVRAVDSPIRMTALRRYGAINRRRRMFYPIYDWRKERLLSVLRENKIKLPIDYRLFGRSFDGIDLRFLYPLKKHLPEDYRRVLLWFPLAELEILRYEYAQKEI